MTIKEKILNDYILEKGMDMSNTIKENVDRKIQEYIKIGVPTKDFQDVLNLRDKLMDMSLDDFLNLELDFNLKKYLFTIIDEMPVPKDI